MKIAELIRRLQEYTPASDYTVKIVSSSLIITKHTEVDELEIDDAD